MRGTINVAFWMEYQAVDGLRTWLNRNTKTEYAHPCKACYIEKNSPTSRSALQDVFQVANQHLRHQLQVDAFTDS